MSDSNETWRTSLCSGPYVACCSPCAIGEVAQWTGHSCFLWGLYELILPCCATAHLRGIVRARQGIQGNCCGDLTAGTCCYPCATQQLYAELEATTHEDRRRAAAAIEHQQYHQQQQIEQQQERIQSQQMQRSSSPVAMASPPPPPQLIFAAASPPPAATITYHHPQQIYPVTVVGPGGAYAPAAGVNVNVVDGGGYYSPPASPVNGGGGGNGGGGNGKHAY